MFVVSEVLSCGLLYESRKFPAPLGKPLYSIWGVLEAHTRTRTLHWKKQQRNNNKNLDLCVFDLIFDLDVF